MKPALVLTIAGILLAIILTHGLIVLRQPFFCQARCILPPALTAEEASGTTPRKAAPQAWIRTGVRGLVAHTTCNPQAPPSDPRGARIWTWSATG